MRIQHQPQRRGVAMLLVLISLMTATILTTAYLASRDNSSAIGQNVASATSARWAADAGLEMTIATLQTESDWRGETAANAGQLLTNYPVDGGFASVRLTDLATGKPANNTTEYVKITSTGDVNGVQQTAVANAFVPLEPGKTVDVDLSEFAVFVGESLSMSNQSIITRWPKARLSALGRPLFIGTHATSASSIALANSAAAIDTTVYHGPGASGSLVSNTASPAISTVALLDAIPLPAPPRHGELEPSISLADLTMIGGTATVLTNTRYRTVELKNNAVRTLKGTITAISDEDFKINSGAKLVIDGNVKIVVFGNLLIDQGSIELKTGAKLRLYVRGSSTPAAVIRDGYIGELRATAIRDNTGNAAWMDPQRITLFSVPSGSSYEWQVENNSVIKGSIFAPHASKVGIYNTSALYGRIAAKAVDMRDVAALFFDPALDSRCGFTTLTSPIYDADGRILSSIKTLATLEASDLQLVADESDATVKSDTGIKIVLAPADAITELADALLPGDPTPRPVQVECTVLSFGTDVTAWEQ